MGNGLVKKVLARGLVAAALALPSIAGCGTTKAQKLTPDERLEQVRQKVEEARRNNFKESVGKLKPEQAVIYDALYEYAKRAAETMGPASYEEKLRDSMSTLKIPQDSAQIAEISDLILVHKDPNKSTPENEFRTQEIPKRAEYTINRHAYHQENPAKPFDELGENTVFLGIADEVDYKSDEYTWSDLDLKQRFVNINGVNVLHSTFDQIRERTGRQYVTTCDDANFSDPSTTSAGREAFMKTYKNFWMKPDYEELEKILVSSTLYPNESENSDSWNSYKAIIDVLVEISGVTQKSPDREKKGRKKKVLDFSVQHIIFRNSDKAVLDSGTTRYLSLIHI